jgi:site-specific DNA-methyltransferase (adenine-specific)
MKWKNKFPKENRYFETENGILYCGDAIEIMKTLPKGCINFILTDPPYNISKKNNFPTMKNKYGKPANRTGIDFGEWDKGFDLFSWIDYGVKLLNKNGSMFIFNDWKNIGEIAKYAEKLGMDIKDCFRWEKLNPMPRNRDRRYIVDFELAVWLVKKNAKWTFNRQDEKFERPKFVSGIVGGKEKTKHPTQKPVSLLEHLLKIHSNEGDILLDLFIGSGTTAIACEKLNRRWIGIELQKEYCDIIVERLK